MVTHPSLNKLFNAKHLKNTTKKPDNPNPESKHDQKQKSTTHYRTSIATSKSIFKKASEEKFLYH